MKEYTARFTLNLIKPIKTSNDNFSSVIIDPSQGNIKHIELTPIIESDLINKFKIIAVYTHENIWHCCYNYNDIMVMIGTADDSGILCPPHDIAKLVVMPMLYNLSGLTFQSHIYCDMIENLKELVSDYIWILPDGTEAKPYPAYFHVMATFDPKLSGTPLDLANWEQMQSILNGTTQAPLWKVILARASRQQNNDARYIITECATALDVGVAPYLEGKVEKFNMDVFKGHTKNKTGIPDLQTIDSNLFHDLTQLWYTRHGIVHRGGWHIYDKNPIKNSVQPIREIEFWQDIPRFLLAVPRGIEFIENYSI